MELSLWANHPKARPSLKLRGDKLPLGNCQNLEASDYYGRHPMTYIRCQSHVILGLFIVAASPLPLPPSQNYNPKGAPHVTLRAIAFNSHGVNLLTV